LCVDVGRHPTLLFMHLTTSVKCNIATATIFDFWSKSHIYRKIKTYKVNQYCKSFDAKSCDVQLRYLVNIDFVYELNVPIITILGVSRHFQTKLVKLYNFEAAYPISAKYVEQKWVPSQSSFVIQNFYMYGVHFVVLHLFFFLTLNLAIFHNLHLFVIYWLLHACCTIMLSIICWCVI